MEFTNLQFSGVPRLIPLLLTRREVELLDPLRVTWDGGSLLIPAGFCSDGPSIPEWLRGRIPYRHNMLRAAFAHDYICRERPASWSSKRAAVLFIRCMEVDGVGETKRKWMYRAVVVAGPRF